ncbi:hypothetical protein [Botrimarina hoheduenensis]|uniref:Competence protein A n=1 Tax=Botrimarina hoheduenensis TaxID=2528000 RepID=A0A5C5VR44_9BACT|nr:hypothetical protein [Botrimarina hoheduenensis]TWT40149.1 Competence protein A [Botrimarina hoheduenensis]
MFGDQQRGWWGVDFGASSVKAAQLRRSRTGYKLHTALIPRSLDHAAPLYRLRQSELAALRALQPAFCGTIAAAGVSMRDCTLNANDSADENAEGTAMEGTTTDTWGDAASSYALSISLAEVEAICEGFDRDGLRCETVDGAPTAIARALQMIGRTAPNELVIGLDWGRHSATLVAAQAGYARYARQLRLGGIAELIVNVAEMLELSVVEADRAVLKYGCLATEGTGAIVSQAVRNTLAKAPAELTRTVAHLEGKLRTKSPRRWVLMGAGGVTPGIKEYLAQKLGVSVEVWTPQGVERSETDTPICLFGPAIALSALRWEESE